MTHPNPAAGATIVLNDGLFAGREPARDNLARLLGQAAAAGSDEDAVRRAVEDAIHRSALDIPDVTVDRFVEQIVRGHGLSRIVDDRGAVLFEA